MIIVCTAESAEQALADGTMRCTHRGCGDTLARWGYGRRRRVRGLGADEIDVRPRRVRCRGCRATQILLPATLQPRRADSTEVIGTALVHKAAGLGHRRIAAVLGRSPSTVRRWLRRARGAGHLTRLWQRGAQELIRLDADAFNQLASTGNLLARHPDRPGRRGLVGAPTARHYRARLDAYRPLHRRAPSRTARLRPSKARPTAGPAVSHARLRPSR